MTGPTVVSVVGPGRSGTTILGNVLGELTGWFCTGELRWFWRRGLIEQRRCGCGRVLVDCEVWSRVITELAEAYDLDPHREDDVRTDDVRASLRSVLAWQDELAPLKVRAKVLRSPRSRPRWPALQGYTEATGELLRATLAVTGARVLIDTSKRPHDAAVEAGVAGVEHVVVQVVRDPRAVAHSWGRVKALPGVDTQTEMGRRSPASSVARWMENCMGAELLRRQLPDNRWLLVSYEDFAREPRRTVEAIVELVGAPTDRIPVGADGTVVLGGNHNVAGNPNRFESGPVVIRNDDEWRRSMGRRARLTVTAGALPMLRRYGYPLDLGR